MTTTPETPRGAAFLEAARDERATHAGRGWPIEHDRERGPEHPLRLALDYLANGKPVEAGSLILAGLDLLGPGDLTDETIERAAQALYEIAADRRGEGQWMTWAEICSYSPLSAEEYRQDARRVLAAAHVAPPQCGEPHPFMEGVCILPAGHEPGHECAPVTPSEDHALIARINHALGGEYAGINTEARVLREALVEARLALLGRPSVDHAEPAPIPDREKLIAELRGWANDLDPEAGYVVQGKVLQSVAKRASAALLAVLPVVNEAKLAEIIREYEWSRLRGDDVGAQLAGLLVERQHEWLETAR